MKNKLLSRLFRRHAPEYLEDKALQPLIALLSDVLDQQDADRLMLEKTMQLMSGELNEINDELSSRLDESKLAKKQLEETLVKQQALLNATPEAVFRFHANGVLDYHNRAAGKIYNRIADMFINTENSRVLRNILKNIKKPREIIRALKSIKADPRVQLHGFVETKTGEHFEYTSLPEILNDQYMGRVLCMRDVTGIRKNQELLKHQAFHDVLTNLPNRLLLLETLEHAIELAHLHRQYIAVLFIDLDDFKKINDTAGHQEGDNFLVDISKKLKSVLREGDILGRLGGDEFLIILEGIDSQRQIIKIHDRILRLFSKPFLIKNSEYNVTCSIGISFYPQDDETAQGLIRKADMAMYQAKNSGKNTYHYFDDSLERIALHRVSMESKLNQAIKENQFTLCFQPKISLLTGKVIGVEALIRWILPGGEVVYPDEFISIAEETGLIKDLTLWVLKTACKAINSWKDSALPVLSLSINISPIDFLDPNFLKNVTQILHDTGVDPRLIEFELTESVFFSDIDNAKKIINSLKSMNIRVSIDDFGTGYSSLSYLHDLDIDYIKIDKSFVIDLDNQPRALAIVKSIIDVGVNLGVEVVAEGVESQAVAICLNELGCHIGQGYFYSRPISGSDFIDYVKSRESNLY